MEDWDFQQNTLFLWKKLWLFGLFSGDKGDYSDVWMIKITMASKEIKLIWMFASFKSS